MSLSPPSNPTQSETGSDDPARFWDDFLCQLMAIVPANSGWLVTRLDHSSDWQMLASVVACETSSLSDSELVSRANSLLTRGERVARDEHLLQFVLSEQTSSRAIVFLCDFGSEFLSQAATQGRLCHIGDVFTALLAQKIQARADVAGAAHKAYADLLALMDVIEVSPRFYDAVLSVCNQLASLNQAHQVSLGWVENGVLKLQAVSNKAHFDSRTEWVDLVESCMEETLDQARYIILNQGAANTSQPPSGNELTFIQHQAYLRSLDRGCLLSVPLVHAGETLGVLLLERSQSPFSEQDALRLQSFSPLLSSVLEHKFQTSGALLRQVGRLVSSRIASVYQIENMGVKLGAVGAALVLLLLCIVPFPYKLSGNFIIEAEQLVALASVRDGLLSSVEVAGGDQVEAGQLLLTLDDIDLRLREAELLSELTKARAEMERAMSIGEFADLRIAEAQIEQLVAELDWVNLQIDAGKITAPSSGLLLSDEGIAKRIGSPINRGETLITLAQPNSWRVMVEIDEAEIEHLSEPGGGQVAFVSRPNERLAVQVLRVEQMARSRQTGPVFRVYAEIDEAEEVWWRPGMTGVAKLDAGYKPLMWIWTHRFFDWLRLRLWF